MRGPTADRTRAATRKNSQRSCRDPQPSGDCLEPFRAGEDQILLGIPLKDDARVSECGQDLRGSRRNELYGKVCTDMNPAYLK